MLARRYEAPTLDAALALVHADLGDDAVILYTREPHPARWRRWLGEARAEVIAMVPARATPPLPPDVGPALAWARAAATAAATEMTPPSPVDRTYRGPATPMAPIDESIDLGPLPRSTVGDLLDVVDFPLPFTQPAPRAARPRAEMIETPAAGDRSLAPPIRLSAGTCRRVAFVGATGAGKTTTIAKLACAHAARGCRVALIAADTRRVGAVAQLDGFAGPLGAPLLVATGGAEADAARARVDEDAELALVDLPGLHPRWDDRVLHARAVLAALRPHEVIVVVSAVTQPAVVRGARSLFAALGATKAVLTRADEATVAQRRAVMRAAALPFAYVAFAPSAPGGIAAARSRLGARWLADGAGAGR